MHDIAANNQEKGVHWRKAMNYSAPGGIRTHGHTLRRRVLYPLSYGRSIRHHNNNNPCDVSSMMWFQVLPLIGFQGAFPFYRNLPCILSHPLVQSNQSLLACSTVGAGEGMTSGGGACAALCLIACQCPAVE